LCQGADVWLNTPRRPQEACGTSGMKAALNGGLNCSILDGWWDELLRLGHRIGDAPTERFNMAVMGLRLAGRSNAVSKLHGEVSREMFSDLWPDVPTEELPITSVTNGVHAKTWVSAEMSDLLSRHVLPEWDEAGSDRWDRIDEARDDEVWRAKEQGREQLVAFVRRRLRESALARGLSASDVTWCDEVLDGKALTVCFARRFATYKRATLLLEQSERLASLVLAGDRPVQFVFAGKAHPADDKGKEMIRHIVSFAADLGIRHRFVFLEDYDIAVARTLYQGADIWLNTPRRPQEACGTSGMKAALNGALNCSILDGWWNELFNGENGWAISSVEQLDDEERRDELEANSLFEILERQVVPLFYERFQGPVPRRWVRRMKTAFRSLGPEVTAARMVRDYVEELYEPTARQADRFTSDAFRPARDLAAWKARVLSAWEGVDILAVETEVSVANLGADRSVEAEVALGTLSATDVQVQLVHGPVGQHDEIEHPTITAMTPVDQNGSGSLRYTGAFTCDAAGRYGFTVRVVPSHPDLITSIELGRVAWA
jgi:starch phosphorylase